MWSFSLSPLIRCFVTQSIMYYYNHQLLTKHTEHGCCLSYNSTAGFKLQTAFWEDIFIRICLSTHRKGTFNQLNPAYSHSAHSHIYSKSAHSSVVARLSFYWSLGLHCVAKWIPLSRDPGCHNTNNKFNKHSQRPVCLFGRRHYESGFIRCTSPVK